jgi:hypothetical protein
LRDGAVGTGTLARRGIGKQAADAYEVILAALNDTVAVSLDATFCGNLA